MISQNTAERSLNITSILKLFKSLIKRVYIYKKKKNGRKILRRKRIKLTNSRTKPKLGKTSCTLRSEAE